MVVGQAGRAVGVGYQVVQSGAPEGESAPIFRTRDVLVEHERGGLGERKR